MNKIKLFIASLLLVTSTSLSAWWDAGHMSVAQLAYEELNPEVQKKVDGYLQAVSGPFPDHSDFISASVWADDIVHEGINAFFVWHGSARPYDPQGLLSENERKRILTQFENNDIVWALRQCVKTLRNRDASAWAKGFMLRMLTHLVGDVHQPLHCITYYGPEFPEGDRAGTQFKIKHPTYSSLHSMFDSAFGLADRQPSRPVTQEDRGYVNEIVTLLRQNFPRDALTQVSDQNFDHWHQESYEIGAQFAYTSFRPNESPSPEAMEQGRAITSAQLALAGYRLADLLNDMLQD